jgi:site-specific recombinase XerD
MTDQLPAIIEPNALTKLTDAHLVPVLIADLGEQASWRYVEFFTANIRNPNTRRAYARACSRFFAWCDDHGLTLTMIRPFDVAAWVEDLQEHHSAPGVKQQLAALPRQL